MYGIHVRVSPTHVCSKTQTRPKPTERLATLTFSPTTDRGHSYPVGSSAYNLSTLLMASPGVYLGLLCGRTWAWMQDIHTSWGKETLAGEMEYKS